jgi:hypothetical protein
MPPRVEAMVIDVTKELINQGKLIEAGFVAYRLFVMSKDAPPVQVDECRLAFMAGADHVFSSMMSTLDPDAEPTDADLKRLDEIHAELERWRETIKARVAQAQPTKGSA